MELLLHLLFLLLPFFVITSASPPLRLELLHRHQVNTTLGSLTRSDRLREILHSDLHRHLSITTQISGCYNGSIIGAPLRAGRDLGVGQYFVEVSVGSPPQKFRLVADTGSELMWMRCRYKDGGDVSSGKKMATFEPERSSTFRTVACSSRTCKVDLMNLFSLRKCPTPKSPCAYHYSYIDGTEALGIFAYDTVTIDLTNKLHQVTAKISLDGVLVGCTQAIVAQAPAFHADGILGLAYSNQSFTSKAGQAFGPTFSYCLVDHLSHMNRSSYLTFGPTTATPSPLLAKMHYTELELNALSPFYAVNVRGISVGGKMLRIPSIVWDPARGGGTIVDSGTSLTFLTDYAYRFVVGALDQKLKRFTRLGKEDGEPLDYCFNATQGYDESVVPRVVFHFADGARFKPPVKSYVIHVSPTVRCLGLVQVSWPGQSLIGNIMQQNHLWSFNVADRKLGFAPSSCL